MGTLNFVGFDIETAGPAEHPEWALQPWRASQGARVTWVGMGMPPRPLPGGKLEMPARASQDLSEVQGWLAEAQPEGTVYVAWKATFDLAWALAYGWPVHQHRWLDAMLLWKWLDPNRTSYSLAAATREFLGEEPWIDQYLALKEQERREGFDTERTGTYVSLDACATATIAERLWERLADRYGGQVPNQVLIEAECLIPTAQSWLDGIPVDPEVIDDLEPEILAKRNAKAQELGLELGPKGSPVVNSPPQLAKMLYEDWGWPIEFTTPKGAPSTNKTALTYAVDHDPRAATLLEYREMQTRWTKFIKGARQAEEHLGGWVMHPEPKIYSTYTGRFTYGSKQRQTKDDEARGQDDG